MKPIDNKEVQAVRDLADNIRMRASAIIACTDFSEGNVKNIKKSMYEIQKSLNSIKQDIKPYDTRENLYGKGSHTGNLKEKVNI